MLLSACSTMPPSAVDDPVRTSLYEARVEHLAGYQHWNLAGRLAVSNSEDGGSGTFNWNKKSGDSEMNFHGALGRGAWRLLADSAGAELELADGTIHRADTVDQLVQAQLGWEIPIERLSWWVRGLVAPGDYQERVIDEAGNLTELLQGGWKIEYGRYRSVEGVNLPVKFTARQADWKVKLAVRNWELFADRVPND